MTRGTTENGSIVFLLEKLTNDVDQISLNQLPQDGMKPIETKVRKDLTITEKAPTTRAFSWLI